MLSYTKERVAVLLYHAQNERLLESAQRAASDWSGGALALLAHRVAQPYRSWEAEDVSTRDHWRGQVDRLAAKLGQEFPVDLEIPSDAGLCGAQP